MKIFNRFKAPVSSGKKVSITQKSVGDYFYIGNRLYRVDESGATVEVEQS